MHCKDKSTRGQHGLKGNGLLWLSVSLLKCTAVLFCTVFWFITLTEGKVFADRSLFRIRLTINNEERHRMSRAKCLWPSADSV